MNWCISIFGLILAIASFGCHDDGIQMRLLVYDKETNDYIYDNVTINTLNDLKKLDGEATVIKSGLEIEIDYQTGELDWKKGGHDIAFGAVRDGSVLVPDSFDSLSMASIYYSMELSYLFFKNDMGLGEKMPARLPTYYDPEIQTVDEQGNATREIDNAFYMKVSDNNRGFFIVPFSQFQWIPMALNSGILTHEYTHYIFDKLVLDHIDYLTNESTNFMHSVNEATSDFLAVVRTQDPKYMSHTVPKNLFVTPECNASTDMELSRDIGDIADNNYNTMMDFIARQSSPEEYCPYEIGLFLASTLYEAAIVIDVSDDPPSKKVLIRVGKWWLNALERLGTQMIGKDTFEISDLLSLFIDEIQLTNERQLICDILSRRYEHYSEVEGC